MSLFPSLGSCGWAKIRFIFDIAFLWLLTGVTALGRIKTSSGSEYFIVAQPFSCCCAAASAVTEPFPDNGRLPGKGLQLYGFGCRRVELELQHKQHRWWKDNDVHLNSDCVTRAYFTKSQNAVGMAWYDHKCCGCVMIQLDCQSCSSKLKWTQLPDLFKLYFCSLISLGRDMPNGCYKRKCLLLFKGWAKLPQQITTAVASGCVPHWNFSSEEMPCRSAVFLCGAETDIKAYIKALQSTSFSGWDHGFEHPLWSRSSPLIFYHYWCESCCLSYKILCPSVASPSSYWEVWRSPVWHWTFSSCSSTPFFCAADGTKTRSSPMPTAAARPGVSSSPHSSAGWYKCCFSRRSGE